MSRRMRDIAQHVARGTETTAAYPSVSGLAALRGDFAALQRELVEEAAHSMGSAARRLEASLAVLAARRGARAPGRGRNGAAK